MPRLIKNQCVVFDSFSEKLQHLVSHLLFVFRVILELLFNLVNQRSSFNLAEGSLLCDNAQNYFSQMRLLPVSFKVKFGEISTRFVVKPLCDIGLDEIQSDHSTCFLRVG